jgi:hypothetical protein
MISSKTVETTTPVETACANCGATLQGAYCHRCGQKNWGDHGWSLGHFLHELFHEFTHVDSSILATFRTLFRPGELTAQYLAGRRIAFVNPIRLYLLVTAVFFFFGTATDFTTQGLARLRVATGLLAFIQHKAHDEGVPYGVVEQHYDAVFHKGFSLLMALAIVVFSMALWLLMRNRDPWLAPHVVFGLHCYTFFFLARMVVGILAHSAMHYDMLTGQQALDGTHSAMAIVILPYLLLALRRVYREPWSTLLWKWALLIVVMAFAYGFALLMSIIGGTKLV